MKNSLLVLFVVTTVVLAGVCTWQWRKLAGRQTELKTLRSEAEQQAREIADLQASQKLIERQRKELFDQTVALAASLQAGQREAIAPRPAARTDGTARSDDTKTNEVRNAFGQMFAKMMEDPETKKMVREQQRMMLDRLYAPLIKQMNLTPEEATQFKDLLADNMMKAAERATSLFSAGASTNRTEMFASVATEQRNFDEQVRSLLGESRYAQYQDYQQTVGERTQLNQFRQQFSEGEASITDAQSERLLGFIKEEKQNVTAAGQSHSGAGQVPANMQAMLSGEGTEKVLQAQEDVNRRVYERARAVLTENQLSAFGRFQTNQLQMMRMGLSMARKFMAPERSGNGAPPPNQ